MNEPDIRPGAYTKGPIGKTMIKTAFAMLAGTLAMSGYNIADTYFVGQLGWQPLAAMGFTFPVIMLIGCLFHGIGAGIMTTAAQGLGRGNHAKAAKLITSGLLLIVFFSAAVAVIGILTEDWTFRKFGASGPVLDLIADYMNIWYIGCFTASVGMAGNSLLIAAGDSKMAGILMSAGMLVNVGLDPLFIFGAGPFPAMGMQGAALATVLSQLFSSVMVLWLLHRRHRLILWQPMQYRQLKSSWKTIIRYAIPASLGMLMMPLGSTVLTAITAKFGEIAVAASAAAGRLEMVAFVFPMSLGISLLPMIGQNYGARLYSRINQCRRFSMRFAFFFLMGMGLIYIAAAPWLVRLFSPDPEVQKIMVLYMRIVPFGFAAIELHRYSGMFFTGCGKPAAAAWLNALRIVGLLIPFSLAALWFHSLPGLFAARLAADLVAGGVGCALVRRLTRRLPADYDTAG